MSGELTSLGGSLARALAPYNRQCVLGLGAILVEVGYGAITAMSFGWLVDKAILPRDATMMWWLLGVLAAAVVSASAVGVGLDYLQAQVGARAAHDARRQLFAKLCELSLGDVRRLTPGDVLTRFATDLNAVEVIVGGAVPALVRAVLSFLIGVVLLFALDVRLALVSAVLLPLSLAYARVTAHRTAAAIDERRAAEGTALGAVQEALDTQAAIKALDLDKTLVARFLEKTSDLVQKCLRGTFLSTMVPRSSAIGVNLLELVLMALLAIFALRGLVTVGTILAFHALFTQTSIALLAMTQIAPSVVNGRVAFGRIERMLSLAPTIEDEPGARDAPRFAKQLHLIDVRFGYEPHQPVLDGLSLTVQTGESVAIVGPSGSGKSTILGLILRFYDPEGGELRFDDVGLRRLTRRSVRAQIGYVMQSPLLFEATLRENVRFGRPDATDAEVEAACKEAEVSEFVADLPQGYDTPLGPEAELSGGQRQRVALARALVRDPAILLLDEATSALDPTTESQVMASLRRARQGRTTLFVTHRLTTITDFDRIVVVDEGKVAESGKHEELLGNGGLYTRLWNAQGVQLIPREPARVTPVAVPEPPASQLAWGPMSAARSVTPPPMGSVIPSSRKA